MSLTPSFWRQGKAVYGCGFNSVLLLLMTFIQHESGDLRARKAFHIPQALPDLSRRHPFSPSPPPPCFYFLTQGLSHSYSQASDPRPTAQSGRANQQPPKLAKSCPFQAAFLSALSFRLSQGTVHVTHAKELRNGQSHFPGHIQLRGLFTCNSIPLLHPHTPQSAKLDGI